MIDTTTTANYYYSLTLTCCPQSHEPLQTAPSHGTYRRQPLSEHFSPKHGPNESIYSVYQGSIKRMHINIATAPVPLWPERCPYGIGRDGPRQRRPSKQPVVDRGGAGW